jgi:hypothetical protein
MIQGMKYVDHTARALPLALEQGSNVKGMKKRREEIKAQQIRHLRHRTAVTRSPSRSPNPPATRQQSTRHMTNN